MDEQVERLLRHWRSQRSERGAPRYRQVVLTLRHLIADDACGRLPTERRLVALLGVSRGTIRAALAILAGEQVISRRRRAGTLVLREANWPQARGPAPAWPARPGDPAPTSPLTVRATVVESSSGTPIG